MEAAIKLMKARHIQEIRNLQSKCPHRNKVTKLTTNYLPVLVRCADCGKQIDKRLK